jgi:hypothetical protein
VLYPSPFQSVRAVHAVFGRRSAVIVACAGWRLRVLPEGLAAQAIGPASGTAERAAAKAARYLPRAQLEIFEADQGGQRFMFLENPAKFSHLLADFTAHIAR